MTHFRRTRLPLELLTRSATKAVLAYGSAYSTLLSVLCPPIWQHTLNLWPIGTNLALLYLIYTKTSRNIDYKRNHDSSTSGSDGRKRDERKQLFIFLRRPELQVRQHQSSSYAVDQAGQCRKASQYVWASCK